MATVKAYYSMFHAARALLYHAGYREKSHAALGAALRETYVKSGKLRAEALTDFENAMDLREKADYALTFSLEGLEACSKTRNDSSRRWRRS